MASEINEAESSADLLRPASSVANSNKLYLFFWHPYSTDMYTLYEIGVTKAPTSDPPTKADEDVTVKKPTPLSPILVLKTGEYPGRMTGVRLRSKFYFFGGEFNIDDPYIEVAVKNRLITKETQPHVFPPEVYIFNLDTRDMSDGTPMKSGKASPYAFVANEKIYVVGSTIEMNISDRSKMKGLDLKSFHFFEVYHDGMDTWEVLPDPPMEKVETKWVGHAVVESKALLVAWQRGKERLYCFDLLAGEWIKYAGLPSYLDNFSGRIEYVEETLYGCYHNTIAAIPLLGKEGEEEAEEFKHHCLHLVSEESGMDAIFKVTPQLDSSSSLLHLGNRFFCYVRTGRPLDPNDGSHRTDTIQDGKRGYISIVIFQTLGETYEKDSTRFFRAEFLHSAEYVVDASFSNEGFLEGCFSPVWDIPPQVDSEPFLKLDKIVRHNPKQDAVIILQQWLKKEENKDNWCLIYRKWNVNRPKEEARQIIQGILSAVYAYHSNGSYHGFLYHPENFAIYFDESVVGDVQKIKLIHTNVKLDECFGLATKDNIPLGMKNDMLAMSSLIFNLILGGKSPSDYPLDLQNLRELLRKHNVSSHDWKHIVNHPSLWHWESRFSYFKRVWVQFLHANRGIKQSMQRIFRAINTLNWRDKVTYGPLRKLLADGHHGPYRSTTEELLRYLSDVHHYFKSEIHTSTMKMELGAEDLHPQFIEQKITEIFELFLVNLYNKMCDLGIEI